MRRVATVSGHLTAGAALSVPAAAERKPPPPRDHTPGEHQPVARQLGVTYGPTALVKGVHWIGFRDGPGETEGRVLELQDSIELRDTDCWISTYPKCGTTWTHQISLLLTNDGNPEAWDGNPQGRSSLLTSWPEMMYDGSDGSFLSDLADVPNPRLMKTHAPWQLLPGRRGGVGACPCKAIYVTRNPKDACVSMMYHAQAVVHHLSNEPTNRNVGGPPVARL